MLLGTSGEVGHGAVQDVCPVASWMEILCSKQVQNQQYLFIASLLHCFVAFVKEPPGSTNKHRHMYSNITTRSTMTANYCEM